MRSDGCYVCVSVRERELSQYDDKATDLEINIRFPIGGRDDFFSSASRQALRPTEHIFQRVTADLSKGDKRQ